jgi:hypothetical protein
MRPLKNKRKDYLFLGNKPPLQSYLEHRKIICIMEDELDPVRVLTPSDDWAFEGLKEYCANKDIQYTEVGEDILVTLAYWSDFEAVLNISRYK